MNWSSITFDWNRARAFLVTAEEGSLSAAARALGLAQPTLSRQVEALQQELGVILFERFGRGLELTPAGAELLAHVRRMGEAAMALSIAAEGQSGDAEGTVTLSISDAYAGLLLPKVLKRLQMDAPKITIRIVADNTPSDLLRREADIAVRNFRPKEPDLIARKLTDMGANFYAATGYLEEHGTIRSPEDWANARLIVPEGAEVFLSTLNAMGVPVGERQIAYECNSYLAMWEMVKEGLGIGILDTTIGDKEPTVARAAPEFDDLCFPIWLTAHRDILQSQRMRVVFDFLAKELLLER